MNTHYLLQLFTDFSYNNQPLIIDYININSQLQNLLERWRSSNVANSSSLSKM